MDANEIETSAHQVTTHPAGAQPAARPTGWGKVVGIAIGLSLLVGVLVTAFAWPAANSEPRDVPIAVAGPPEALAQVEQQLSSAMPDAFGLEPAADADAARELIRDREVYGAIVFDPAGPPQVLTASAASPAVAQLLQGLATQMAGDEQPAATPVEDVVPLPADDARGAGFSAAALPMVMGGMMVGIAMSFVVTGVWRRVGGVLAGAAGAGMVATLVVQTWLGSLDGNYWANAGAIALTIAAIAMTLVGLASLIGPAGIGLGAVVIFLVGNPLSGVASAPEMLPSGLGTLGQWLPAGAGGSLLRSTSFFDGAAAGGPVLVLAIWLAGGILLAALSVIVRTSNGIPSAQPAARA